MSNQVEEKIEMTDEEYIKKGANKVQLIKLSITIAAILIAVALCIKFWNADGDYQATFDGWDSYKWTYTIQEEGIIEDSGNDVKNGSYTFTFKGIKEGTVDVVFTETDNSNNVIETQTHTLKVNSEKRIFLDGVSKK